MLMIIIIIIKNMLMIRLSLFSCMLCILLKCTCRTITEVGLREEPFAAPYLRMGLPFGQPALLHHPCCLASESNLLHLL